MRPVSRFQTTYNPGVARVDGIVERVRLRQKFGTVAVCQSSISKPLSGYWLNENSRIVYDDQDVSRHINIL